MVDLGLCHGKFGRCGLILGIPFYGRFLEFLFE
jgi:hypothetical protein